MDPFTAVNGLVNGIFHLRGVNESIYGRELNGKWNITFTQRKWNIPFKPRKWIHLQL